MSPISYEHMSSKYPKYADAIRTVEGWIAERPGVRFIELYRISDDLSLDTDTLAMTLTILENAGLLSKKYRVEDPNGVQLEDTFGMPHEVPPTMGFSTGVGKFKPRKEGRIIPGYWVEPIHATA